MNDDDDFLKGEWVTQGEIAGKIVGVMIVTALVAPVCIAVVAFFLSQLWKSI